MNYQIIILAAGKGTRMGREDLPKVLVPLNSKPMIFYLIEKINQLALKNTPIIVIGHHYELVQKALGPNFIYAFQQGLLGTGHAVAAAKLKATGSDLLVLYGDMPFVKPLSLEKIIETHKNNQAKLTMFTTTVSNFDGPFSSHKGFGRIIRSADGRVSKIVEFVDATDEQRAITEVNPGIYMFDAKWLWDNIEKLKPHNKQNELYLTDMIELAVSQGLQIADVNIDPLEVFGINTPQELEKASTML